MSDTAGVGAHDNGLPTTPLPRASHVSRIGVVAGINTHACVCTTVVDAYQRDYEVVVAVECVASYDEEHHEMTMRYLDGAIARLLPNREIIEMLAS